MVDKAQETEGLVKSNVPAKSPHAVHRRKCFRASVTMMPLCVLMLIGLVVSGVVLEINIISVNPIGSTSHAAPGPGVCSPTLVNAKKIEYHSGHRYYSMLKDISPLPPPSFHKGHRELCKKSTRYKRKYGYCLPISGRKDSPFCTAADRMDLLNIRSSTSVCYASVLHMLMVEVYEELQASGNTPFLAFGSLLGAVRNGSMIPFTEDADVGFVGSLRHEEALRIALRLKGYHMFHMDIWRVCVAPTHPLAGHLYDPTLPTTKEFAVPYLDLYSMKHQEDGNWNLEELEGNNGSVLPDDKVWPFSQVTINGMPFDTVREPTYLLEEAYGPDYMTPLPRTTEPSDSVRDNRATSEPATWLH